MNVLRILGVGAVWLLFAASGTALGDPASVDTDEPNCTVGALVFAFGAIPTLAQIRTGDGQSVAINGSDGRLTCRGRLDLGAQVIAAVAFLPGPVFEVPVTIMTYDQICYYLPLLVPGQGCSGGHGAVTIRGIDVGIRCSDAYFDAAGNLRIRSTFSWQQVVAPSGVATITCFFD